MSATPRPWDFEGMTIIEKATRKRLMVLSNALGSDGVMEHEGNCEILLNAVNAFDAMREALEVMKDEKEILAEKLAKELAFYKAKNGDASVCHACDGTGWIYG